VNRRHGVLASLLLCAGLLGGCRSEGTELPPERPVLFTVVQESRAASAGFAGTVEPRIRSGLGFRILGRVIARDVNAGDQVTKGQRLAALDPQALDFAVRAAKADFANSTALFNNAAATEGRNSVLFEQRNISADQFEQIRQARQSAEAAVTRARTTLDKAVEQRGYAELTAEYDGIVTSADTEVGQTVSAGQAVITIARPDIREAVIDVDEDISAPLTEGTPFEIALQMAPARRVTGRVREISPQLDPLTHSRRVKITLAEGADDFRLGATITAYLAGNGLKTIKIPAAAVWQQGGQSFVWIVDLQSKTVASRPVRIASVEGNTATIAAGLQPGTRVVTAGVHFLAEGQLVKVSNEASE
jgi:membrane fusion protein, multidrug efflux system